MMPCMDNPPIPVKKESGIEMTNAHGQEITRNVQAR